MPKFTVLIIEDEKNIQTFVGKILKKQDYRVLYADCGKEGLNLIHSQCPDVIILDLGLPDMNGNDIIQEVRTWTSTPIIVISARSAEKEKVLALDQGADDYITKPFAIEELLARIRVALKRKSTDRQETHKLEIHGVSLDTDRHEVMVAGEPVELTNREFELLHTLMENKNIVMDREKLMNIVCGYEYVGETNIIDVYVRYLRTKIDDRFGIKLITTVRGVGYVIRES